MYTWTAFDDGTDYGGEIQYSVCECREYGVYVCVCVCVCVCVQGVHVCVPK